MIRILIVLCLISNTAFAQKLDTAKVLSTTKAVIDTTRKKSFIKDIVKTDSSKKRSIPRTALIRSLVLPGWGQATNKQYWVIPIVYGAAAGGFFAIHWNNWRYFYYRNHLKVLINSKEESIDVGELDSSGFLGFNSLLNRETGNIRGKLTKAQLEPAVKAFRRQRDLSYIMLGVGWVLQAVQANVSAHLKGFDMTEDISLQFEPALESSSFGTSAGVKLRLNF